jgi:hypothetical protein
MQAGPFIKSDHNAAFFFPNGCAVATSDSRAESGPLVSCCIKSAVAYHCNAHYTCSSHSVSHDTCSSLSVSE